MRRILTIVLLVLVTLGVGFYFYQRNIAAVSVTAADLDKGGSYSTDERTTFKAACVMRIKKDGETVCSCINDKIATEFSRFDRLVITASFQEKLSDIVGLTKGLVQSGIPAEKVKTSEEGAQVRIKEMLKTCRAE